MVSLLFSVSMHVAGWFSSFLLPWPELEQLFPWPLVAGHCPSEEAPREREHGVGIHTLGQAPATGDLADRWVGMGRWGWGGGGTQRGSCLPSSPCCYPAPASRGPSSCWHCCVTQSRLLVLRAHGQQSHNETFLVARRRKKKIAEVPLGVSTNGWVAGWDPRLQGRGPVLQ